MYTLNPVTSRRRCRRNNAVLTCSPGYTQIPRQDEPPEREHANRRGGYHQRDEIGAAREHASR